MRRNAVGEQDVVQPPIAKAGRVSRILLLAALLAALLTCLWFSTSFASDYMDVLDTYWDIHDQVLFPTERGGHYIDLFWAHSPELCEIVMANPGLADEGAAIMMEFEPPLRALVDGYGASVVITESMVHRADAYLTALHELASPELRVTIESERARTPLEGLIGLTFEEARIVLVGLPEEPLPGPLPTRFP